MIVNYQKIKPRDLWIIEKTKPSPAKNMCLKFKNVKGGKKIGFGIYALSYQHSDKEEHIIYIGKFSGKVSKTGLVDNAMDGDARTRWFKHIGTATLLLADLRIGSKDAFFKHKKKAEAFFKNNKEFIESLDNSIFGLNIETLEKSIFKKNGNQISDNRLGFAIQNLVNTNPKGSLDLQQLNEIISKFTCHYWQISLSSPIQKSRIKMDLEGTNAEPGLEKIVIAKYRDKLPMNNEYVPNTSNNFYHYDEKKLINVRGSDFWELDSFIRDQSKKKFAMLAAMFSKPEI